MENIIEVNNVSIKFNMSTEKVLTLKEYFIKMVKKELRYKEFWALKEIEFSVRPGGVLGIIGLNGAGKSTLLKILSGILKPTTGSVRINGNIAPLIELGAGFDMELTARENIYLNGAVLGYTRQFISEKFDDIVEFSEMKDFIDVPLKNYSSGMVARIAFAIATLVKPDILIVDEILSVGDFKFQKKCEDKIHELMNGGTTVVMVSHSITQIEELCDHVIWLEKGKLKMYGETERVCNAYKNI
ncbi:ABC transporter [Clostridium carnis]|uniref:ABC transporter n=1 Tax=Clostridium carnis TaxID=1530 RepID=A0ABY6SP49_9CLOT|nr:ABC transporter ATP-binding protein [Clostridium carnis]VDG69864.1 ABC transporter [Clostridium carnis]